MVWKRSNCVLIMVMLLFPLLASTQDQAFEEESWQEAIENLDYGDQEAMEKRQQEDQESSSSSTPRVSGGFIGLGATGQIILVVLLILLLIFIIARLMGHSIGGGGARLKKEHQFSIEQLEENIHESDLERFLRLSLEAKDYHTALRIYYLMVIKRLSELGWILWKKEKTNYDYVREMRKRSGYSKFRSLTGAFEIIWYGEAPIGQSEYEILHPEFRRFVDELNATSEEDNG